MKSKAPKVIDISVLLVILLIFQTTSCGNSIENQPATAQGFATIEKELNVQFGKNAYYTDLSITYNQSLGNIIGVTVTEDPESLKMGQWNLTQGHWQQHSDITFETPIGTKASDYMFQLGDTINLSKLGELVAQSIQKTKDEKNLEHLILSTARVYFPDNGDLSKAEYFVNLQPKNGGTTFRFRYSLNGDLITLNY